MTANPPPIFPAELEPLHTELSAYYKELTRLLDEGGEGKFVLFKGDTAYCVWDTYRDGLQYAYDRFGTERFLLQRIDRRFLVGLEAIFGPLPTAEPEAV